MTYASANLVSLLPCSGSTLYTGSCHYLTVLWARC